MSPPTAAAARSLLCLPLCLCLSCASEPAEPRDGATREQRRNMVEKLDAQYRIKDARVLEAMSKVRRHMFIPERYRDSCDAYGDHPCPIGHGQTISQPYIVAYMTERLELEPGERVLEVGTGSGYQAAVLAQLGVKVYSIEILPELADHARAALASEDIKGVKVRTGDGYRGWPEHSPFDAVIATAAPAEVPPVLVEQLREGGRMMLPLGTSYQRLVMLRKKRDRLEKDFDIPVRFVPMVRGKD